MRQLYKCLRIYVNISGLNGDSKAHEFHRNRAKAADTIQHLSHSKSQMKSVWTYHFFLKAFWRRNRLLYEPITLISAKLAVLFRKDAGETRCKGWHSGVACVIPIILYCAPAIFPGLHTLLRRLIKLISNVCGLGFNYLTNLVCERHIKASTDLAARVLADSEHPLNEELSKARSHTSTRSRFKLLRNSLS